MLVWVLAFRVIPLRVTAVWILGLWVATQLFMALLNRGDQIAWWAHIGGLAAGGLLIPLMRRPDVVLFDRLACAPDAASQDAWWHTYQSALFHRGLLRLRNPRRWLRSLARYLRARLNQMKAWVARTLPKAVAVAPESASIMHRTADILSFEQRGSDFVLMRNQRMDRARRSL